MSDNKLLTISVAAYNVEKYLDEALKSLAIKELLDDIEVLVVDDGATDNSFNIAKSYEDKYPYSFKAVHKENAGYGSTVNYSIDNARGKYFKLLDGDDWYEKEGLIKLVNIIRNCNSDVVLTQFYKTFSANKSIAISFLGRQTGKEIDISEFEFNAAVPMHAITIKTDILRKSKIRLPERILYTDNIYAAKPFMYVETLFCENFPVYNYRQEVAGQSVSDLSLIKHIDESISVSVALVKFYNENVGTDIKSRNYIAMNIASTCVNAVVGMFKMKPSKIVLNMLKDFDNKIKNISYDIYVRMGNLDRNASKVLKLIRSSNYLLYWIFASRV